MNALEARAPRNVLVVAMANKLARIVWAVPFHQGLQRNGKGERTVTTAYLKPASDKGLQRPTDL